MKRKAIYFAWFAIASLVAASCAGLSAPTDRALGDDEIRAGSGSPKEEKPGAVYSDETSKSARGSSTAAPAVEYFDSASGIPSPAPSIAPGSPPMKGPSAAGSSLASRAGAPAPTASGLKAGFSDDNAQFNYFAQFLDTYKEVGHYAFDISERLTVRVLDSAGKPVANAKVTVYAAGGSKAALASGLSFADGGFRFYPAALGTKATSFEVAAEAGRLSSRATVGRDGPRLVEMKLGGARIVPSPVPLDVLFVMDTTGSMGEEIDRLKATIEIIYANLSELKPKPLVRFGLVLYKDRGDEYITEIVPFTGDLGAFQAKLDTVSADGGGDGPEDLESALDDAVNKMDWNTAGLRLGFIVTDAESHLDYGRDYTYVDAANDARAKAIKLYTIGTGGLPLEGEYVLRQISQLTDARYIFLTYGEGGEASGGSEGSVSHHTGSNFTTDKLEAIVMRFVKEEVSFLSNTPLAADEDYYSADKVADESRDQTLDKLFAEAIGNLADYSTYRVGPETPCIILPIAAADEALGATAEYFGERLSMASAEAKRWKNVERKDLQKILAELELQLSGLVDEGSAAKVGHVLGADVLVSATLYKRSDRYELFLRLVRVSTAEVLAVSRAKIALDLGL